MSQEEIKEIELSIEHAKEIALRGEMAEKLATNHEFKKLILDGYFRDEAARLALLSSDPALDQTSREHVLRDLNGPGSLKRYLSAIVQMGRVAQNEIREAYQTMDEIRAEGSDE